MHNYKLCLEYNGEGFYGSQLQTAIDPNTNEAYRTVQGELEKALRVYLKEDITCTFSSRTDAGVHALGQVVNFKTESNVIDSYKENLTKVLLNLNGILPTDLVVSDIEEVSLDFHSRFDAKAREYNYKIFARRQRPVLKLDSLHWEKLPLCFEAMSKHAKKFLGKQDFSAYCKKDPNHGPGFNYECDVLESEVIQDSPNYFIYKIKSDRFLHNMVRNIVGELIHVGKGNKLASNSRPHLSPAKGLTLKRVIY